jgi:hypothetical protein
VVEAHFTAAVAEAEAASTAVVGAVADLTAAEAAVDPMAAVVAIGNYHALSTSK